MVRRSLQEHGESRKGAAVEHGEIIDRMAQDTESHEPKDTRQRYKGICPVCGKENWICKSLAMEMGNQYRRRQVPGGCDTFCTLHTIRNGKKWIWKGSRTTRTVKKPATT